MEAGLVFGMMLKKQINNLDMCCQDMWILVLVLLVTKCMVLANSTFWPQFHCLLKNKKGISLDDTQGLFQLNNQLLYIYLTPTMCQELYYVLEIH